jgi:phosphoglycerol transferase
LNALAAYAFAVGICLLILVLVLRLWRADLRVPFCYGGDSLVTLTWAKGIAENGWYLDNPSVGAPFGLEMHDFPMPDNLLFLLVKLFLWIASDVGLAVNLYFLATFPFTTATALFAFRRMGLSYTVSIAVALLYAFAPYHFMRGEMHLFLASYFLLPVMALIILRLMRGQEGMFIRDRSTGKTRTAFRSKRAILTLLFCFGFPAAGIYYAYFACFFLAVAALAAVLTRKRLQPLLSASMLIFAVGLGALLNLSPSLLYRWQHGVNSEAVDRHWVESEVYGMRFVQLLMPVPGHRVHMLAEGLQFYQDTACSIVSINENACASLGAVAGLGFLFLLARLLYRTVSQSRRSAMLDGLSKLNLAGVLLATLGGLGTLVSLLGFHWIRCYNRISIFLAFFALAAVGIVLQRLQRRLQGSVRAALAFNMGLVLLVTLGVLDQTSRAFVPPYAALRQSYQRDEEFIGRVEASMPPNAMIFQLPYVAFPESIPPFRMGHYDHTRAFLHSKNLRWSHGAMKGRMADLWQRETAARPIDEQLLVLVCAGFDGIYIDRYGYEDGAASLECPISDVLGASPIESADGRFLFFPLTSYRECLRTRYSPSDWKDLHERALFPVLVQWTGGLTAPATKESGSIHWCEERATLTVTNDLNYARRVRLEMKVDAFFNPKAPLTIEGSLLSGEYLISNEPRCISWTGLVPPGIHSIDFVCPNQRGVATPDRRSFTIRVQALTLQELESQAPRNNNSP